MTSQQEADQLLSQYQEERERKEREARLESKKPEPRLIIVGDHTPEQYRGAAA